MLMDDVILEIRTCLSLLALSWLLEQHKENKSCFRRDLFVPYDDTSPAATSPAAKKELKNKDWQIKFLKRLVNADFIRYDRGSYSVMQPEKISTIIQDHKGGGSLLSKLVQGEQITPEDVCGSNSLYVKQHMATEENKMESENQSSPQQSDKIEQAIMKLVDAVFDSQKSTLEFHSKLSNLIKDLTTSVESTNKDILNLDKQLNGVKKRVEDVEKTLTENKRLAESDHKLIKDFTSAPSSEKIFESAMGMMKPILGEVQSRIQEVGAVREAVEKLCIHLKAQEENQIQKAIKQLNTNLEEGKALQEVLLQIASK